MRPYWSCRLVTGIADDLIELAIISDNPKKTKTILEEF